MQTNEFQKWFAAGRSQLAESGLWADGGESGRPDAAGFESARCRLLIARLSASRDVLHSITHRLLLGAARRVPGVFVDLAFLPPEGDLPALQAAGVPWWLGTGAKRAPSEYDIVAVSMSVAQEALNLPAVMQHSGLALTVKERLADAGQPLILLGGQSAHSVTFIHGPTPEQGLVDAVCFGDGATWLQEFLRAWLARADVKSAKRAFLAGFGASVPGTYVPWLYRHEYDAAGKLQAITPATKDIPMPVRYRLDDSTAWLAQYDGGYIPFSRSDEEETLPLTQGCAFRCRFCQTGWLRGELSCAPAEECVAAALRLKRNTAASDLNLLAADACALAGLDSLVAKLQKDFRHVSIKSLTVANLAKNGALRAWMAAMDKREFSLGIEGVSARLRRYLGKPVDAGTLENVVADFAARGLRRIKLFFVATGLEEEADWNELDALLTHLKKIAPRCHWLASFTPLFCAPLTPMQYSALRLPEKAWVRRVERIVERNDMDFRWSAPFEEVHWVNCLCRAGRRAHDILMKLSLEDGFLYTDRVPAPAWGRTLEYFAAAGIHAEVLCREGKEKTVFPWDDFQGSVKPKLLWTQWRAGRKALAESDQAEPIQFPFQPAPLTTQRRPPASLCTAQAWVRLLPEDALRPDVTLARGLWRKLFLQEEAWGRAYSGDPAIQRYPDAFGLARLTGSFRADLLPAAMPIPAESARWLEWGFQPDAAPEEEARVYRLRLPANPEKLQEILQALKAHRVAFHSQRQGEALWHTIGKTHQRTNGLVALAVNTAGMEIFALAGWLGTLKEWGLPAMDNMECTGIYLPTANKCPRCGTPRLQPLREMGAPAPACLLCRPGNQVR